MSSATTSPAATRPRDVAHWARSGRMLDVVDVPPGAMNLNVDGQELFGALQGFGQLWQKTYRVRLHGITATPEQVMQAWKENFARFQPDDNHFHPPRAGMGPGKVIFIDTMLPAVPGLPGVIPLASGVMVLYEDETSLTVMTPAGFPEAGWNTFSTYTENGCTVAQVQSLARATDPVYEFGFRFMGGSKKQEATWRHVLTSLAGHFDVTPDNIEITKQCLDTSLQWPQAKNVWQNAGIRTMLYRLSAPLRGKRRG